MIAVLWRCDSTDIACEGYCYLEPGQAPGPCANRRTRVEGQGPGKPSIVIEKVCGSPLHMFGEVDL